MGRRSCAQLALCCHLITLCSRVDCFVGPVARLPVSTGRVSQISARRCRIPRLPSFKRGRSAGSALAAAAEGEENGTGLGLEAESKRRRITRAPLRITPNFEPRDKRKSNADAESDVPYGVFLTEESLVIAAMAWAEFSYWLRRTVERNVNGPKFEFDVRQWSSSIRKWCSRAVEMDAQAKAELLRLYDRGMLDRDWWGPQAVKVDARVEDEWDSIYMDCQDACESSSTETRAAMAGGDTVGRSSNSGSSPQAASFSAATYSDVRRGGAGARRGLPASDASGFDLYVGGVVEEGAREDVEDDLLLGEGEGAVGEDEAEGEGFDDEEIIDCAIRGRWTFDNNDDPPHFSPQ